MKILYDGQIFSIQQYGGISRYFCELVRSNISHTIQTRIFAPFSVNNYLTQINNKNLSLNKRKLPLFRGSHHIYRNLSRLALTLYADLNKYDLIHETYYHRSTLCRFKGKIVTTVHDMTHEMFPHFFSNKDCTSELKYASIKRSDHVICISENTKKDVVKIFNIDPDRISVVYHGYNQPIFIDSSMKYNSPRPYILYVGNRSGYKNFLNLFKAYVSSPMLLRDYMIICFGGGDFNKDEKNLFREHDLSSSNIAYTKGDDKTLNLLYHNASVFIYPSFYEGFGIPLLEAMSSRCPVACSNTGSFPEVGGDAVAYFDPQSVSSIMHTLVNILDNSIYRDDLINKGVNRLNYFSWNQTTNETLSIYSKLF
ncbi:glycosyltransferase family 1 protein [Synechococcus sp. TAK9802]|uniref:glycosyltransferase family 4 protein n=1 Tax=Synechococcus sp. TAK9802 TaxID=1442558 RepID=UPI001861D101|nr:glycosyltransferase family 1 protein [Synechococcus sp. TAK9802]QNI60488.1 putative alpha-glycosyltransferase/ family 4 [Synechococcus sp. TAK9802]